VPGVWSAEAREYGKALRAQYEASRRQLQLLCDQTVDLSRREALDRQLEQLKVDFQRRLDGIRRSLFGAG
jgi:hypothetical protein